MQSKTKKSILNFIKNVLPCASFTLVPSKAFTMAEILISLTIIGVIAAITLPALVANINEKAWATQRKALYSRISQAISMMPSLNGYGNNDDNAAQIFITNGLSKVFKINNICDYEHLNSCGIAEQIKGMDGEKIVTADIVSSNFYIPNSTGVLVNRSKVSALTTANNESLLVFYNKNCIGDNFTSDPEHSDRSYAPAWYMCANFIYDLNGKKGPNTMGKDIGYITAFYPTDSVVVAPMRVKHDIGWGQPDASFCRKLNNDWRMPDKEELMSIYLNRKLKNDTESGYVTLSTSYVDSGTKRWFVNMQWGELRALHNMNASFIRCIKR